MLEYEKVSRRTYKTSAHFMTRHSPNPLLHFSLGRTTMFFLRLAVLAMLCIAATSALPNPFPDPAGHNGHRGHGRKAGHGGHPRHPDHPAHLAHPAYPAAHPAHPAHPRNPGGRLAHPARQAGPQVSLLRTALLPRIPQLRDTLSSSAASQQNLKLGSTGGYLSAFAGMENIAPENTPRQRQPPKPLRWSHRLDEWPRPLRPPRPAER